MIQKLFRSFFGPSDGKATGDRRKATSDRRRATGRSTPAPASTVSHEPSIVVDPNWADPWFHAHFDGVAGKVAQVQAVAGLGVSGRVLDFGCGDGINSSGVATRTQAAVVGVDLTTAYGTLPDTLRRMGVAYPQNLSFVQSRLGHALPFPDGHFDRIYSWSVFEHVAEVGPVLSDLYRITQPGGKLFIQVEPLFYGPFGSHLGRLIPEPWAHLRGSEMEFLERAWAAEDRVPEGEKDVLYRTNEFQQVKKYLLGEYGTLNRISAPALIEAVVQAGYTVEASTRIEVAHLEPHPVLAARYGNELLKTTEVLIQARRV